MGLRQEAEILSNLNHPNIVKFRHIRETNNLIFIGMELIRGGTLSKLIRNKKLSEKNTRKVMFGILSAVDYLHSNGIGHRDLKPENILLSSPRNLDSVKLVDFGLSD